MTSTAPTATDATVLDFERAVSATLVVDAQISPDGRQVAYVTTEASKTELTPSLRLWLVSANGGPSRRLATSDGMNSAPRWSPDGARLVFLSDRKQRGVNQVYILALAGGEAMCVTDHAGGVGEVQWSPDGTLLAYTANDAETDEEKKRKEERDDAKVADSAIKRSSLWVLDVPDDPAAMDTLPEPRRVSQEGQHIGGLAGAFSWAPDSRGLVALVTPSPKAHDGFYPDLVTFDLNGEMKNLGKFEGLLSRPSYSPDGSTIGFIACEDKTPSFFALRAIPAGGGESRVVLPKAEASFYNVTWLPDGDRLLVGAEEGQQASLKIVDPESRTVVPAVSGFDTPGSGGSFGAGPVSLSRDGAYVAFVRADSTSFGDVYVAELGGAARKLTDLNPWTREQQWGETREISWTSFDGLEIQGLLILPVSYQEGTRYPTLLHIHGGPCGAWTEHLYANWHDWGQFLAQRGYVVFMPNPRGSSGRGSDFLCAISGCYGEPDWQDLMTGVDYLIEQGIVDPEQLVVGGWSGGGFLTNWTITHTDRFKAAISGAGISNWVSFQGTADVRSVFDGYLGRVDEDPETHWRLSPIRSIKNATTPTLILYGEADERVPVSQGYELYEGLKSRGVETQLVVYPREPHGLQERTHQLDLLRRVVDWYDGHLGRT